MAIDVEFTTPPTAPSSTDADTFRTRADAFVAWIVAFVANLAAFVTQINSTEENINAKEASAVAASEAAVGAANYQGNWVAGSYSKGVSVSKDGFRYCSKINLNTDVPPSANWEVIGTKGEIASVIHSSIQETPGDTDELCFWDSFTMALRKVTISGLKTVFAPLNSPALTGNPTAPTPSVGDNGTSIATTAFATNQDLGVGQTWQDVTASRVLGTTYTNTTGKPIMIQITHAGVGSTNTQVNINLNGITFILNASFGSQHGSSIIIPNNNTYAITITTGTLSKWLELR